MRPLLCLFVLVAFVWSAFAQCVPGPGQVAVFKHSDYDGTCRVLAAGNYPSPRAMGFPNDEMSSVRIGAGAQVVFCEHDNYGGRCETFTADDPNFGNNPIRHDRVSSARVTAGPPPACDPNANQVSLFEDANHGGLCVTLNPGEYHDPLAMGFPNDKLTSIKVGSASEVVLCQDVRFLRDCELFTSTQTDLTRTRVGNDTVSSIIVRPRGASPCLPARDQVSVYMHRDFEGPCVVKNVGEFATPEAIGIPNDSISSARVGAGVQLVGCVDVRFGRDCERFEGDVPNFVPTRVGNDRISSIKVQNRGFQECVPLDNQASFFVHVDYLAPCVVKPINDYKDDAAIGLPHDSISSIRVGAKAQVCACLDASFTGACETFTADDRDLRNNYGGKGNDAIGSIRVQPRGAACTVTGYRAVRIRNCPPTRRELFIWGRDITTGDRTWKSIGTAKWQEEFCRLEASVIDLNAFLDRHVVELHALDSRTCRIGDTPDQCLGQRLDPVLVDRAGGIKDVEVP